MSDEEELHDEEDLLGSTEEEFPEEIEDDFDWEEDEEEDADDPDSLLKEQKRTNELLSKLVPAEPRLSELPAQELHGKYSSGEISHDEYMAAIKESYIESGKLLPGGVDLRDIPNVETLLAEVERDLGLSPTDPQRLYESGQWSQNRYLVWMRKKHDPTQVAKERAKKTAKVFTATIPDEASYKKFRTRLGEAAFLSAAEAQTEYASGRWDPSFFTAWMRFKYGGIIPTFEDMKPREPFNPAPIS